MQNQALYLIDKFRKRIQLKAKFKNHHMINKVTLIGHLGRDPETRTLESGAKVSTFTLATSESYKDKNDQWQSLTEWHNIVAWRYQAEKAERELKKGSLAYVEGKITHRKYNDKDGVERSITEIVAAQIISLDRKDPQSRNMENNPLAPGQQAMPPLGSPVIHEELKHGNPSAGSSITESEDDLPF